MAGSRVLNKLIFALALQQPGRCVAWAPPTAAGVVNTLAGSGNNAYGDGLGTTASFGAIFCLAVTDNGSAVFVSGRENRVRKIVVATQAVTLVAGSGTPGFADGTGTGAVFNDPKGLVVSHDGQSIYASEEWGNQRIRKIDLATGVVTTLVGNGQASSLDGIGTSASLNYPYGLTISSDDSVLYVADLVGGRVRKIVVSTRVMTTLAGSGGVGYANGVGSAAIFNTIWSITLSGDDQFIYVADRNNQRIRKIVVATREVSVLAGSGISGNADGVGETALFDTPAGVVVSSDGAVVYASSYNDDRIRKILVATQVVSTLAGSVLGGYADGVGPSARFSAVYKMALPLDGTVLYVGEYGNYRVRAIGTGMVAACAAGKFSTGGACTSCASGQYSAEAGASVCTWCASGKFIATTGASSCLSCPAGQFQTMTGQTTCLATPAPTSFPALNPTLNPISPPSQVPTFKPVPFSTFSPTVQPTISPNFQLVMSTTGPTLAPAFGTSVASTSSVVTTPDKSANAEAPSSLLIVAVAVGAAFLSFSLCIFIQARRNKDSNLPRKGARVLVNLRDGGRELMAVRAFDRAAEIVTLRSVSGLRAKEEHLTLVEFLSLVAKNSTKAPSRDLEAGTHVELTWTTGISGTEGAYIIPRAMLQLEPKPFAQGGGGQIFRGRYMGNQIAAKQTFIKDGQDANTEEFDREVAILNKCVHPCILSLYGVCRDADGAMFMVVAFCGGGDLDSYYKKKEFNNAEFVRVILEVLSGVSYLHQRNIAHRDLKPANVLLELGSNKVKITDFGLAKSNRQTVTRGVGTPAFMPPEMFSDEEQPEKTSMIAVDIYAIAVIMWQLWFKKIPFANKSVHQIMARVIDGKRLDLEPSERPTISEVYAIFENEVSPTVLSLEKDIGVKEKTVTRDCSANFESKTSALGVFLGKLGLEKYEAHLVELGITDVEMLSDREICDDDTLVQKIAMTKMEIRSLRNQIESTGTGPTMTAKKKNADNSSQVAKRDAADIKNAKVPVISIYDNTSLSGATSGTGI